MQPTLLIDSVIFYPNESGAFCYLYEFDCGFESGWMYQVNGWFLNYGCSAYEVQSGDEIVWCYTRVGLGADLGAERMG